MISNEKKFRKYETIVFISLFFLSLSKIIIKFEKTNHAIEY